MRLSTAVLDTVGDLCQIVADLHRELTRNELVIWTAGNVSARVPDEDLMVIFAKKYKRILLFFNSVHAVG